MYADRDASDLGVPSWDGLDHEERQAQIIQLRLKADQIRPSRGRRRCPEATKRQREAAKNLARRSCQWERPSRSKYLLVSCDVCGAPEMSWCRRAGRTMFGKICDQRGM